MHTAEDQRLKAQHVLIWNQCGEYRGGGGGSTMLLIAWLVRLIPWIQMCQKSVLLYCRMPRRVESHISMDLQAINIYLTALFLPMTVASFDTRSNNS